jgi:uncharacterized membrane protein
MLIGFLDGLPWVNSLLYFGLKKGIFMKLKSLDSINEFYSVSNGLGAAIFIYFLALDNSDIISLAVLMKKLSLFIFTISIACFLLSSTKQAYMSDQMIDLDLLSSFH